MDEQQPSPQRTKTFTFLALVVTFILSFGNLFVLSLMAFAEGYAQAMSHDSNIRANTGATAGVEPFEERMLDVLQAIDSITCMACLVGSIVLLILFNWWHQRLYLPAWILICLTVLQVILSLRLLVSA